MITLRELNPIVRGANVMELGNLSFGPRYNYGYQILYVFSGKGEGIINGGRHTLDPGKFFLYGPGDEHCFKNFPPEMITIGTHYFSPVPVSEKKLKKKNAAVARMNKKYWKVADEKTRIEGLPKIPFCLIIPEIKRPYIEALMRDITNAFAKAGKKNSLHCKAMLLELLLTAMDSASETDALKTENKLESFENFIAQNYMDCGLSRKTASQKLKISESYLTALLRKELQSNFSEYLTEFRMRKAMQLILYSQMMIKEICLETGYKDVSYFVYKFKQLHGKAPLAFRINN
jgi:YesN/AraC family two-component response regulator